MINNINIIILIILRLKYIFIIKICINEKINERCIGYIDIINYIYFLFL